MPARCDGSAVCRIPLLWAERRGRGASPAAGLLPWPRSPAGALGACPHPARRDVGTWGCRGQDRPRGVVTTQVAGCRMLRGALMVLGTTVTRGDSRGHSASTPAAGGAGLGAPPGLGGPQSWGRPRPAAAHGGGSVPEPVSPPASPLLRRDPEVRRPPAAPCPAPRLGAGRENAPKVAGSARHPVAWEELS